jgi:hypothetical protein
MILDDGVRETAKLFGGINNMVNSVFDGDYEKFIKEFNILPYRISSDPNLYINDFMVDLLDLPETNSPRPEKQLGDFRWTSGGINYKFTARLYRINYTNGEIEWRVVGTSGDSGFGYSFISKRNTLGKRARMQIFKQIIDKYDLDRFK